jgi:hypothetical protein
MRRDIKDFVSQKGRSKYHTVNNLPGFIDVQNANLFVMYVKARFLIKFEQTKSHNGGHFLFDNFELFND